MADTQTYNHHDIQRYLQQKMLQQEMHDFEKALMNDPFLADALEGFQAGTEALATMHLAEIERKITGEKEDARVVAMPSQKAPWWKVAAVVLLVVSGGLLTYSLLTVNTTTNNIAQQPRQKAPEQATIRIDSIAPADKSLAKAEELRQSGLVTRPANSLVFRKESKFRPKMASPVAESYHTSRNDSTLADIASASQILDTNVSETSGAPIVTGYSAKMRGVPLNVQNEFKGRVVNQNGQPLQSVSVVVEHTAKGTSTDENGNFSLLSTDTVLNVSVATVGYGGKNATIKSNALSNDISLVENKEALTDVVVTTSQHKRKARLLNDNAANAEPKGGWKNFDQYLNIQIDSLKAKEDEFDNNSSVVLEFSIDNKGRPSDIKVINDNSKKNAEKAVEILSRGPKWKSKAKDKKVKVVIPF